MTDRNVTPGSATTKEGVATENGESDILTFHIAKSRVRSVTLREAFLANEKQALEGRLIKSTENKVPDSHFANKVQFILEGGVKRCLTFKTKALKKKQSVLVKMVH